MVREADYGKAREEIAHMLALAPEATRPRGGRAFVLDGNSRDNYIEIGRVSGFHEGVVLQGDSRRNRVLVGVVEGSTSVDWNGLADFVALAESGKATPDEAVGWLKKINAAGKQILPFVPALLDVLRGIAKP